MVWQALAVVHAVRIFMCYSRRAHVVHLDHFCTLAEGIIGRIATRRKVQN